MALNVSRQPWLPGDVEQPAPASWQEDQDSSPGASDDLGRVAGRPV